MRPMRVTVSQIDEEGQSTALAQVDFPADEMRARRAETLFEDVEATTQERGKAVLRPVLQARWATRDAAVTEE